MIYMIVRDDFNSSSLVLINSLDVWLDWFALLLTWLEKMWHHLTQLDFAQLDLTWLNSTWVDWSLLKLTCLDLTWLYMPQLVSDRMQTTVILVFFLIYLRYGRSCLIQSTTTVLGDGGTRARLFLVALLISLCIILNSSSIWRSYRRRACLLFLILSRLLQHPHPVSFRLHIVCVLVMINPYNMITKRSSIWKLFTLSFYRFITNSYIAGRWCLIIVFLCNVFCDRL